MKVRQTLLNFDEPRSGRVLHMCLNTDCFYCETIMGVDELVWKDAWDSDLGILTPVPYCPSCGEVIWREVE